MSDFVSEPTTNTAGLVLPKSSVRRIMKLNDEVGNIAADAVITTTKAAELFLLQFVEAAKAESVLAGRKTIKLEDMLLTVEKNQLKFEFLNDAFVPKAK